MRALIGIGFVVSSFSHPLNIAGLQCVGLAHFSQLAMLYLYDSAIRLLSNGISIKIRLLHLNWKVPFLLKCFKILCKKDAASYQSTRNEINDIFSEFWRRNCLLFYNNGMLFKSKSCLPPIFVFPTWKGCEANKLFSTEEISRKAVIPWTLNRRETRKMVCSLFV